MKDHTTNPDVRKTLHYLLLRMLNALGRSIFREDDRQARDHGWQIIPRHGGLSRSYRDPRFNRLIACTTCNGRGYDPHRVACSDCDGTGRIILDSAAVSRAGRRQS